MQIPHQRFHTRKCITKLVTSKIINNSNKWASSPSANAYLEWLFVHTCDSHVCEKKVVENWRQKQIIWTNNKWKPCYKKHNRKLVKQHISHGAKKGREKVRKRENWRIGNLLNCPKYTNTMLNEDDAEVQTQSENYFQWCVDMTTTTNNRSSSSCSKNRPFILWVFVCAVVVVSHDKFHFRKNFSLFQWKKVRKHTQYFIATAPFYCQYFFLTKCKQHFLLIVIRFTRLVLYNYTPSCCQPACCLFGICSIIKISMKYMTEQYFRLDSWFTPFHRRYAL